MSCASLPVIDEYIDTYICETNELENAVITWSVTAFMFLMVILYLRFSTKWPKISEDISYFIWYDRVFLDSEKLDFPVTYQFMVALQRLAQSTILFVAVLLCVMIVVYSGFKLGSYSDLYNTHETQYLYLVSGVLLKGIDPACTLLILFFIFFGIVVNRYYQLFVTEWLSVVHLKKNKDGEAEPELTWTKFMLNLLVTFACVGVSFLVYAAYIIGSDTDSNELFWIQIGIIAFNNMYRDIIIPLLIEYLFPSQFGHTSFSTLTYTAIIACIDFINPWVAILLTDDLCLHQTDNIISSSYPRQVCLLFNLDFSCYQYGTEIEEFSINAPFIYSHQCRTAMFRKFIPLVLFSCAFNTFISPLIFYVTTRDITNLEDRYNFYGFKTHNRNLVMHDLIIWFAFICQDIAFLIIYGIVSPFCAVALGCSIVARCRLLKECIYRFYRLQFDGVSDIKSVPRGKHHIEIMCGTTQKYVHVFIWPGLISASFLFAFYLGDMSEDTDTPSSHAASISILVLIIMFTISVFCAFIFFRRYRMHRVRQVESFNQENIKRLGFSSRKVGSGSLAGVVADPIENPMRGEVSARHNDL